MIDRTGFEKLRVYNMAEELADIVWKVVKNWDYLPQKTIGIQLINSADSIGANIAEGTGRGSFADNRRFAKIARGSLFEVKHWLRRSYNRKLLTQKEIDILQNLIQELTPKLSAYIQSIGKKKTDTEKCDSYDKRDQNKTKSNADNKPQTKATDNRQPTTDKN